MLSRVVAWFGEVVLPALADPDTPDNCRLDPPPCRVALYPGAEVAWDVCEATDVANGQLWAALQPLNNISTRAGKCARMVWTAQIGITRCAAGPDNSGNPPPVEEVTADAIQQALDADTIASLIHCCLPADDSPLQLHEDVELVSWTPLTPQGGCVGGFWTVRGAYYLCC